MNAHRNNPKRSTFSQSTSPRQRRRRGGDHRGCRRRQHLLESLEPRPLMSTTTLNGTAGDNSWLVTALNAGDTLVINGNGGHDTVKFAASSQNVKGTVVLKNPAGSTFDIIAFNTLRCPKGWHHRW